jgi:putative salt-induced outer membrane protein
LAYDKDRFSGFDHKESATVGLGRRLIENEKHLLKGEAGAGSRREELDDGTTNTNAIFLGNLDYRYTISENAEFTQTLLVEMGKDNDYMESITKLKANIVGNLAVAVSYTVKNNSNPPPANEKTDTYTAISLEYKF